MSDLDRRFGEVLTVCQSCLNKELKRIILERIMCRACYFFHDYRDEKSRKAHILARWN